MSKETLLPPWHAHQRDTEHARFVHVRRGVQTDNLKQHLFLGILTALLLVLAIGSCTVMRSPLITILVLAAFLIVWLVFRYPWLALLLILAGAGLPSLTVPLPGHTMRPIEAAICLCLLLV